MRYKTLHIIAIVCLLAGTVIAGGGRARAALPPEMRLAADTLDNADEEQMNDTVGKSRRNIARERGEFNALDYILDDRWRAWGEDFTNRWDDHLFIEAGVGVEQMVPPGSDYRFNALTNVHVGVGKQFNRYHSARLTLNAGWGYQQTKDRVFKRFGLRADHLFSLSSYFDGYNPARLLDFSTVLGVGVQQSKLQDESGLAFEAHAGLQLRFFTGPQGYFTVEPYIGIGTDKMDLSGNRNWRKNDVFYGAQLSYVYYIHNNLSPQSRMRFVKSRKETNALYGDSVLQSWQQPWFVEFSNGAAFVSSPTLGFTETLGHAATISVGKWLSPVIGVKLSGSQTVTTWRKEEMAESSAPYHPAYERTLHNTYSGVRLEALFNPFGFDKDYVWERPWGVYAAGGVEMGWITKYQEQKLSCRSESYTAAIHGWLRLSDGVQVFIEPRYNHYVYKIPYNNVDWNKRYSDDGFSLNVGLSVATSDRRFRTYSAGDDELQRAKGRIVAGIGAGLNLKQTRMNYAGKGGAAWNATVFGEYHLNHISAVRLSFTYATLSHSGMGDFYDYNGDAPEVEPEVRSGLWDYSYTLGVVSAGYMVNLSSLFCGYREDRRFDLSLFAGPSVMLTIGETAELNSGERIQQNHTIKSMDSETSKTGFGLHAGMKLGYRLNSHIGLFLSPTFYLLPKSTAPGLDLLTARFFETVNVGVSYAL